MTLRAINHRSQRAMASRRKSNRKCCVYSCLVAVLTIGIAVTVIVIQTLLQRDTTIPLPVNSPLDTSSSANNNLQEARQTVQEEKKDEDLDVEIEIEEEEVKKATKKLSPEQRKAQDEVVGQTSSEAVETLVLKLSDGHELRIMLRPDWSPESVDYVKEFTKHAEEEGCGRCGQVYCVEHGGAIVQGRFPPNYIAMNNITIPKGSCPAPALETFVNNCERDWEWNPECGPCHGPLLEKGMVAWAAGGTGPDFFINLFKAKPALWWGTQHTVWGQVVDSTSMEYLKDIAKNSNLQVDPESGLHLIEPTLKVVNVQIWELQ